MESAYGHIGYERMYLPCIHLFISQGRYIKQNSDIKHRSRFQREGSCNLFKANIIVFAMPALNEWGIIPISNNYSIRITYVTYVKVG